MVVCALLDSARLALSAAVASRRTARGLPDTSFLYLRLNSCRQFGEVWSGSHPNLSANCAVRAHQTSCYKSDRPP